MLGTHLVSFILSQFFGMYLLIVAIVMLLRVGQYRKLVYTMNPASSVILLAGLIGLMIGLFFVGIHNVWILKPIVFITLMCWSVLIFSILLLVTPEKMAFWAKRICSGSGYYIVCSVMILLGLMFVSRGLYQYATHHQSFIFMHM